MIDVVKRVLHWLRDFWVGPASGWVRALIVLYLAIEAIRRYGRVLNGVYPIADWLFLRVGLIWFYGFVLSLACVSFGYLVVGRVLRITDLPALETVVLSAAVGLVGFCLGMYAGGFLGLYGPTFGLLLPAALILSGAAPLLDFIRRAWRESRRAARERGSSIASTVCVVGAWIGGVVATSVVYLGVMTPEAINFDSAWFHLPIAQDYARNGRIVPFVADYTRNFPHLASIIHTWAWIVPGHIESTKWMQALHGEFVIFLWTLAGVAALTRWMLNDKPVRATWAAFYLFPAIFVYDSNLGGGADHFLAFFGPPLLLAAVRAARRFDPRQCVLVGVMAGGALLAKYQAMYVLLGVAMVLAGAWLGQAYRRYRAHAGAPGWSALAYAPLYVAAATLVVTAPHFVKNWVYFRNPVYPFMQDFFVASTPTTPNASYLFEYLFKDWRWRPQGTTRQNLKEAWKLFRTFSFEPHYSFTKNVPNFGSLYTLCLPFIPFMRKPGRIALGAAAGAVCIMMWGLTFHVDRHLQSFAPLLAAATAAMIIRAWELGWVARAGVVPLVCLQIVWGGDAMFYNGHTRIRSAIELIRGGYDGKRVERFSYRREFRDMHKALPPTARVLLHSHRANLGIDREIWSDIPGNQGLILYADIHGQRALYELYHRLGITHLLHVPGRQPSQTKQDDILFLEFVKRYGVSPRRFGGYELVEVPRSPPPPDQPYHVLSWGLRGYANGLYKLEDMAVYEMFPPHLITYPKPRVPLAKDGAGAAPALAQASAVLVGGTAQPPGPINDALRADFVSVGGHSRRFTVYIRREGLDAAGAREPATSPPSSSGGPPEEPDDDPERENAP